jgi:ribosomal protein L7/L12
MMPQDPAGWIALFAALALGFALGRGSGRSAAQREALMRAAPPPKPSPEVLAEVRALLAAGSKIEAIKLLREATGMDLKAAKEAVEALEAP